LLEHCRKHPSRCARFFAHRARISQHTRFIAGILLTINQPLASNIFNWVLAVSKPPLQRPYAYAK
jgi:hypothetical protein